MIFGGIFVNFLCAPIKSNTKTKSEFYDELATLICRNKGLHILWAASDFKTHAEKQFVEGLFGEFCSLPKQGAGAEGSPTLFTCSDFPIYHEFPTQLLQQSKKTLNWSY